MRRGLVTFPFSDVYGGLFYEAAIYLVLVMDVGKGKGWFLANPRDT